jgi:hypothetical protein
MRKTVQEWMDANNQSLGLTKKKLAAAKRLKKFPSVSTTGASTLPLLNGRAKKRVGAKNRRPK